MSVSTPWRALVEEDDLINQQLLRLVLDRAGFTTDIAPDSDTAIQIAALAGSYEMVVVDLARLGMRALATAWAIRHLPGTRVRRIVAVAPTATTAQRASCRDAGIDDLVTDPRELDNIARTVIGQLHHEAGTAAATAVSPTIDPRAVLGLDLILHLVELPVADRHKLVRLLDRRTQDLVTEITEAIDHGRIHTASVSAHRLEGVASIIQAGRLARTCIAIQAALTAGHVDHARTVAAALVGEHTTLITELHEQVLDHPEHPSTP